jgi:cytochrome c-type biogenesis protein CcmH
MLLWLLFALLTAAVLAAVLAPLAGAFTHHDPTEAGTMAVYRDQIAELEAEKARGLIDGAEAETARLEISRRLLASAAVSHDRARGSAAPVGVRPLAIAIALAVPLLALAVYLTHGAPDLPAYPHDAGGLLSGPSSGPLASSRLNDLIVKVEAQLRKTPGDGDGWDVIAPVYFKLERFRDAADAFARAAALKGETVKRLTGFAQSSVLAADGIVTEEARVAYQKILQLEPGHPEARFWLAMAKEQDGELDAAAADYKAQLAQAPPDAPWRGALEERIKEVTARLGGPDAGAARASAAAVAAVQQLPAQEQAKMIASMVDGLAMRLKTNGKDLPGWLRLVNSYVVLGRKDDAAAALADARKNFAGDGKALAELAELAKSLGLGS